MKVSEIKPLPVGHLHSNGDFCQTQNVTADEWPINVYDEATLAPLLQDLAAHEASNRIKTENLETLREQNAKLREALVECSGMLNSTRLSMRERFDRDVAKAAVDRARAALGESNEA